MLNFHEVKFAFLKNFYMYINYSDCIIVQCLHYRYTVGSDSSLYGIVLDWSDHVVLTLGAFKNTSGPHLIKMLGYDGKLYVSFLYQCCSVVFLDVVRYTMGPDGVQVDLPITNQKWAVTLKFYM